MSILDILVPVLLIAILCFIPAVFLRVAAKLVAKVIVSKNMAYILTIACYLPGIGILAGVRKLDEPWISIAVLVAVFLFMPAMVYGRFLNSLEGRALGAARGLSVAIVQHILMIITALAVALVVEILRHG